MKLKNILIVVSDIEKSKEFYLTLFGLDVIRDFGENVILSEGLVLQEKKVWENLIEREVSVGGNDAGLYFEENHMDDFLNKLEESPFEIEYLNRCKEREWGQRVLRIYDPDKHIIEIAETTESVVRRLLNTGMTVEEVAEKTRMLLEDVRRMALVRMALKCQNGV